jgi:hypothetical protein
MADDDSGKKRNLRIRWASDNGSGKKPSLLLPTKRKLVLLSAGQSEQPPLAVGLLSDQRGRIFGGYYTLAEV